MPLKHDSKERMKNNSIRITVGTKPLWYSIIMKLLNYLKQSRKKARLSVKDMGFLLDYDPSTLSKCEKGERSVPQHIILGYHIITEAPLKKLFKHSALNLLDNIKTNTIKLLSILEEEMTTPKIQARIETLEQILNNIGCLQALSEEDYEDEREDY